ncbi:universal stress protein [Caulobacter sp. 602-1]|uniref:universal stress protein n=1 Tax=Caulobacter sp. 602-1 TaxID=2492472 RepID=UPI000F63FD1B|nr:universal stress protein [Caulobacter sp. 602-1]RRN61790.1 universal stress protein [Caulobacter sp. 602-1]
MSYASILTVLTGADDDALTLASAAELARTAHGQVSVVLAPPLAMFGNAAQDKNGLGVPPASREAAQNAQAELRRGVEAMAREVTGQSSPGVESDAGRIVFVEEQSAHALDLSALAPFADLVVVGRLTLQALGSWSGLMTDALLRAQVPVLVISGARGDLGLGAAIAWNGSPAAARAVRAAMPLLKAATRVVILQDPAHLRASERVIAAPEQLVAYLRRHGVSEIEVESRDGLSRYDGLVRQARSWDAGLLVAGAFEHSRLREDVLGGVTKSLIVHGRTLNLLLAH